MTYNSIIIQNIGEAKQIIKSKKTIKSKIIVFNPDIRYYLINRNFLNIFPKLEYSFSNNLITEKLMLYDEKIKKILNINSVKIDHIEETFINIFSSSLSSIEFYKQLIIEGDASGPWLIYKKNKFISINNFEKLSEIFISKLIEERKGIFNEKRRINYKINKIYYFFFKLLNTAILLKVKKNCIWLTGKIYGQKHIISNIKNQYPNLKIIYISPPYGNTLFKLFKNFYEAFFTKTNVYEIIPNVTKRKNYKNYIEKILNFSLDNYSEGIKNILTNFFIDIFEYQYSIHFEIIEYFKISNPKLLISHQLSLFEPAAMGSIFNRNNKKVYLISHGAHRISDDKITNFEIQRHARGLLYSRFASHIFIQQSSALKLLDNILDSKNNTKIILCKNPIMWSVQKIDENLSFKKNEMIFLHASTFKIQSLRVGIYENSFEYLDNIITLSKQFSIMKNCKLILRLRNLEECGFRTIKYHIRKYKNISISKNKYFIDDLKRANCLISYSSTAIEEAVFNQKFVALINFNKSNKIIYDNKSKLIFKLSKENLNNEIINLENIIFNSSIKNEPQLFNKEFENMDTSLDFNEFINNLFNL